MQESEQSYLAYDMRVCLCVCVCLKGNLVNMGEKIPGARAAGRASL